MANPIYYPSDGVAVAAAIDPQLADNTALTSDWVSLKDFAQVMFVVNVGATDIEVDAKIQSADDSSGTNAADISGLAVTQLTGTDDNKQVILSVNQAEVNTGDTHVAVVVTVGNGTTGAYVSAVGIGFNAEYQPAFDYDVASVAQIKTLS
jgi:hypothetical protein